MLLHCIRHGLTVANEEQRFNGSLDDPLTDPQRSTLREIPFEASGYDAIYCSPQSRAVETAQCLGIDRFTLEPRIAERHLGIFEGLTPRECSQRYPQDFAKFGALSGDYQIPGGESRAQNLERVMSWVQEIACRTCVLAVTHGGTIDFLYRLATGLPIHGGDEIFSGGNATLSEFEISDSEVRLVRFDQPLAS